MTKKQRKIDAAVARVKNFMRSSVNVIYLRCAEELRAERLLIAIAATFKKQRIVRFQSIVDGITEVATSHGDNSKLSPMGERIVDASAVTAARTFEHAMKYARSRDQPPMLLIMRSGPRQIDTEVALRAMENAIRYLRAPQTSVTVILLGATATPPEEVRVEVGFVDFPLPDEFDRTKVLETSLAGMEDVKVPENGTKERLVNAMSGLTTEQAANALAVAYNESLTASGTPSLDPDLVLTWRAEEAKKIGLTLIEPDPSLEIGGLDVLKRETDKHRLRFSAKARTYKGLALPKGIVLTGLPGNGKTLTARYLSARWGLPLILCTGETFLDSKVGGTEAKTEMRLRQFDAMAPAIILFDEVEKMLSGANASGARSDGGTKVAMLGQLLYWLDKQQGCYVIVTANDITALMNDAPEFTRAGRFNQIFFVDLPTHKERTEIAAVHIRAIERDPKAFDLNAIADASKDLSGAEIAAAIQTGLGEAFNDNMREPRTADFVLACQHTIPLMRTASAKLTEMREWAKGRCIMATTPDDVPSVPTDDLGEFSSRRKADA